MEQANNSPRGPELLAFSIMNPDQSRAATAQFIPHPQQQFSMTEQWKEEEEDGCDIYVYCLRHLPDNVSLVRCTTKVINDLGQDVYDPQKMMPRVEESTTQFQKIGAKMEIRGIVLDPSSLLHISFSTID